MKTVNYLKTLILFGLLGCMKSGMAQAPCSATLNVSPGQNGITSFYAYVAGTTTNSSNPYTWNFGNGVVQNGNNLTSAATIYTANGVYTISVTFTSTSASCSATAVQTINITNANGCGLVAGFYTNPGANGLVYFTSSGQNIAPGATRTWVFGDGSPNGSGSTAVHTYPSPGTSYQAKLIINNNSTPACIDSITNNVNTCAPPPTITSTLNANGQVTFSASIPTGSATSSSWTFGDNTGYFYNAGVNPTHNYIANGTFSVTFIGGIGSCSSTVVYTLNVNNVTAPCNINANFYGSTGPNGNVNFTNQSSGVSGGVTYLWNFGDSSPTSALTSPSHVYATNGTFIVTLVADNNYTYACQSTKTLAVNVTNICNVAAGFVASVGANGGVSFANTTTGTTPGTMSYNWTFGDGSPNSTLNSPAHTYANGSYNVMLLATRTNGTLTACTNSLTQVVTVTTCIADASFSMTPTGTPQFWNAYPLAGANVTAASWNWGDNSSSPTLYTTHTYSAAGTYDICLTVTVSCGSINTYCMPYAIYRPTGTNDDQVIQVTVIDPAMVGIKNTEAQASFYNLSPNPNNGSFRLNMNGASVEKITVSVYDLVGKEVYVSETSGNNGNLVKDINLNDVGNGVYFVKVKAEDKVFTKKLVISKQ